MVLNFIIVVNMTIFDDLINDIDIFFTDIQDYVTGTSNTKSKDKKKQSLIVKKDLSKKILYNINVFNTLPNINTHREDNSNSDLLNFSEGGYPNMTNFNKYGSKNNSYKPFQGGYIGAGFYKSWTQSTPIYVNSLGSFNNIYIPAHQSKNIQVIHKKDNNLINITNTRSTYYKPLKTGYKGAGYYKSWFQAKPILIKTKKQYIKYNY